jgi:hypothetical protein
MNHLEWRLAPAGWDDAALTPPKAFARIFASCGIRFAPWGLGDPSQLRTPSRNGIVLDQSEGRFESEAASAP